MKRRQPQSCPAGLKYPAARRYARPRPPPSGSTRFRSRHIGIPPPGRDTIRRSSILPHRTRPQVACRPAIATMRQRRSPRYFFHELPHGRRFGVAILLRPLAPVAELHIPSRKALPQTKKCATERELRSALPAEIVEEIFRGVVRRRPVLEKYSQHLQLELSHPRVIDERSSAAFTHLLLKLIGFHKPSVLFGILEPGDGSHVNVRMFATAAQGE